MIKPFAKSRNRPGGGLNRFVVLQSRRPMLFIVLIGFPWLRVLDSVTLHRMFLVR